MSTNHSNSLDELFNLIQQEDDLEKQYEELISKQFKLEQLTKTYQGIDAAELILLFQEKNLIEKKFVNLKNQDNDSLYTEDLFELEQEKNQLNWQIESQKSIKENGPKFINEITISKSGPRDIVILLFSATLGLLFSVVFVFFKLNFKK